MLGAGAALGAAVTLSGAGDALAQEDDDSYPLDDVTRRVARHGPVACPKLELETYRGKSLRYREPAKVHPSFRERLEMMEKVALDSARRVYGREPARLVHLGTFSCRRIGGYPQLLSEHGLGNAIDVAGFDFGALPKGESLPNGLPKALARPFSVRLDQHWKSSAGIAGQHASFLRIFARAIIARTDIFRVVLGPSYPGHSNHFHLDMAPYRLVDVFEEEESS